jgi:hypothetical protein
LRCRLFQHGNSHGSGDAMQVDGNEKAIPHRHRLERRMRVREAAFSRCPVKTSRWPRVKRFEANSRISLGPYTYAVSRLRRDAHTKMPLPELVLKAQRPSAPPRLWEEDWRQIDTKNRKRGRG